MSLDINKMRNGGMDGKVVWICHYNRPDMNKKPLRNIPPTQVIIRSNDELPKGKKIYYSQSHFSVLNKSGNPTSKIFSPVDTTGYRSYCGNLLYMFETESECNKAWDDQLWSHINILNGLIENATKHWQGEKETLLAEMRPLTPKTQEA